MTQQAARNGPRPVSTWWLLGNPYGGFSIKENHQIKWWICFSSFNLKTKCATSHHQYINGLVFTGKSTGIHRCSNSRWNFQAVFDYQRVSIVSVSSNMQKFTHWWLSLPLWKIWVSQLGLLFIYGKIKTYSKQPTSSAWWIEQTETGEL